MLLYEAEGKQLLARYGITVPRSALAYTAAEARTAQRELGCSVVVKAQVQSGGRGKAGLIRFATQGDVYAVAQSVLSSKHDGEAIPAVLIEERLDSAIEYFVAAYVDVASRTRILLLSTKGGIDVEEHSSHVRLVPFSRAGPPADDNIAMVWRELGAPESYCPQLVRFSSCVVRCFLENHALQVEVNPVAIVNYHAIAMDAKVALEDNACPPITRIAVHGNELEQRATKAGFPMIRLDGDIGVITSGAGLGLATVDTLMSCGVRAANFLDLGGGATADRMRAAIDLVLALEGVRAIFINVHGGLNDCLLLAEGVLASGAAGKVPVLVRMSGYRADEARLLLASHRIQNAGAEPMTWCVRSVIARTTPPV